MAWSQRKNSPTNILGLRQNLCWDCAKACGRCSWSSDFVPVPGWIAEEDLIITTEKDNVPTYRIYDCPEFIRG